MNPSGLVQKNLQNQTDGHFIHNYSSFKDSLSRSRVYTARFGEYTPSFAVDGVEKDELSVNSIDRIDSFSLNAPFKGSIRKIKESFAIPKMALLPLNWDRIYVQPANGDDVPKDANCVLLDFPAKFSSFWNNLLTVCKSSAAVNSEATCAKFMTAVMRMLVCGEYIYSEGSLLSYCGYHGNAQIEFSRVDCSYDAFFDIILSPLFNHIVKFKVNFGVSGTSSAYSKSYFGLSGSRPTDIRYQNLNSFRDFLSDFRDDPSASIVSLTFDASTPDYAGLQSAVKTALNGESFVFHLPTTSDLDDDLKDMLPTTLNLSRPLSYQMTCAHFYSNSGVDFLYSAELYRQYMNSCYTLVNTTPGYYFTWNGMRCPYDALSGFHLQRQLYTDGAAVRLLSYAHLSATLNETSYAPDLYRFVSFAAIFGFRRSLRFVDYFVGSRTRPLAPFNSDVSVNNNAVSVIEVTKRIQGQRFANAVMRTRSKIENYVKSLFGDAPAPDYHNPFFLAREEETIFGDEVQNTASEQISRANSRTGLMSSNSGRYTFTFHNDDNHPCIYIQIISFDTRRHYSRSVDRHMLQVDRYDMFNPDFQYIGDQPVYGIELGFTASENDGAIIPAVFGYQGRDMEYKQNFDIALGGAIRYLPGWFMTDSHLAKLDTAPKIDPDFIRSYPSELDPFYLSLTGYSLARYFHFIIATTNHVSAKRAMAVDPQILA